MDAIEKPGNVAVARVFGLLRRARANHEGVANQLHDARRDDARDASRRRRPTPQRRVNAPKNFFAKRLESSPERDDSAVGGGRCEDAGDVRRRCVATARDDRERPSIARADTATRRRRRRSRATRTRVRGTKKKGVPTHALRSITMRTSCAAQ